MHGQSTALLTVLIQKHVSPPSYPFVFVIFKFNVPFLVPQLLRLDSKYILLHDFAVIYTQ